MFYVSSIKGDKIGITDTKDGIEEFYSNRQVVAFHEQNKLEICGARFWNHEADCTPLVLNQTLKVSELEKRLNEWRKLHNYWTEAPVRDYLACAKIGTEIIVNYTYVGDGDRRRHSATSKLKRFSYDEWRFLDTSSGFSGEVGSTDWITAMIEISCIYSTPTSIQIS